MSEQIEATEEQAEAFDVFAFIRSIKPASEERMIEAFGTEEQRALNETVMRKKPGKKKGVRSFTNWKMQARKVEQRALLMEAAPNPPKYYGGQFRYRPIESCETAMKATIERLGNDGRQFRTYCLTCQEQIEASILKIGNAEDGSEDEYVRPTARMFGAASDHCREHMNHAVVVEHEATGLPLWMAPYSVLKSQTEYVATHGAGTAADTVHGGYVTTTGDPDTSGSKHFVNAAS